jgi:hypothetical protein
LQCGAEPERQLQRSSAMPPWDPLSRQAHTRLAPR